MPPNALAFLKKSGRQYRGPCPLCGSKTGLSVARGRSTLVAHCFACDAPGHELLAALGIEPSKRLVPLPDRQKPPQDNLEQQVRARRSIAHVLHGCRPVRPDDPVWRYLANRKVLPDEREGIPPVLLYHPALPYWNDGRKLGNFPAMLAKIENVQGELVTLHKTYLTLDGQKAPVPRAKKVMTPQIDGLNQAAIQLDEPGCMTLAVAEGIETALAIRTYSIWPTWAARCAEQLRWMEIPAGVKKILLFSDQDKNCTGQRAAYDAAVRLTEKKLEVRVMLPPDGRDWDEFLPEVAYG